MRSRLTARLAAARQRITAGARLLPGALEENQGLAGVACAAAGAGINWGPGWALLVVAPFLLLAAWGSR